MPKNDNIDYDNVEQIAEVEIKGNESINFQGIETEVKCCYEKGMTIPQTIEMTKKSRNYIEKQFGLLSHNQEISKIRNDAIQSGEFRKDLRFKALGDAELLSKLKCLYEEGISQKDIGTTLGMDVQTVKAYLDKVVDEESYAKREINTKNKRGPKWGKSTRKRSAESIEIDKKIVFLFLIGYTQSEIMSYLQVGLHRVQRAKREYLKGFDKDVQSFIVCLHDRAKAMRGKEDIQKVTPSLLVTGNTKPILRKKYEVIKLCYEKGLNSSTISQIVALSPHAVRNYISSNLLQTDSYLIRKQNKQRAKEEKRQRGKQSKKDRQGLLKECYERGLSAAETGKIMGLRTDTVSSYFRKHFLQTESHTIRSETIFAKKYDAIKECYENGMSVTKASKFLKIDIKTVREFYNSYFRCYEVDE